ncbi:hypothetical protein DICPUDRAFT_96166 [Dictyostelium purpureum]|uniref:DH domain-containing protein n=1 Tax=Dictyostelium purpureum TaxID=5786 RepID=F1A5P9_DICPU|nr:uncharacterized protein DICPUDRAFT_96166 [Dictyostelium purpureum]EGC28479.1 hypothetical protein DICPUDRAFT_96166 [Dictyostelium purpureum]|eukprot:XP_003294993.1 hypothetical protein DICPUDRAFT_96166 [Dictyostelium purpureum]
MIREEDFNNINKIISNAMHSSSSTNNTEEDFSDTSSVVFDEELINIENNIPQHLSHDEASLKKERMRQQTVVEFVKTEANYVRDLKLITKLYIEPIRTLIDLRQYQDVFSCTEDILKYHKEIIHQLEGIPNRPPHLQNIGAVLIPFFDSFDYLNLYKEFCTYQNSWSDSLDKLKSTSKIVSQHIETAEKNYLNRGLSFSMLIIKPIQRITKYPLLLKSLIENTPHEHMDYNSITFCYDKITQVLEEVNYQKKLADERIENEKKIKEIEQSLCPQDLKLVKSTRKFIKEGLVAKKIDRSELLRCILFSDLLILAKNKKTNSTVKLNINLENCLVRDSIDSLPGYKEGFEMLLLNEKKEKIIGLYFKNEEEKKEWFTLISQLVGGNIDATKQNRYSWFTKKNSNYLTSSTNSSISMSSLSSTSIDISMSPSPYSSSLNTSKESSPNLESPSFANKQNQQQKYQQPNTISLNSTTPNSGSLRDGRKPPPPPNVKDIFGFKPPSPGPSPNSTLTPSQIDQISPTFHSTTVPSSSNFSRASSVPSFYNLDVDPSSRHSARRMPQTISSIPMSEMDASSQLPQIVQPTNGKANRPPPPPRNQSPYNTLNQSIDSSNEYSSAITPRSEYTHSNPSSGINTPLSSSSEYMSIKNSNSKSFNNLLPPPPLTLPPLINKSTSSSNINSTNIHSSLDVSSNVPPLPPGRPKGNSPVLLPPPPPIDCSHLPPISYDVIMLPPPPIATDLFDSLPPPPIDAFSLPPPPPEIDSIPIPSPNITPLMQLPPPVMQPPPQTTPPSTLMRAKSPANKPAVAPRNKSPVTITNCPTPNNNTNAIKNNNTAANPNNNINNNAYLINNITNNPHVFKKCNSEMNLPPPPPLVVKAMPVRSTTNIKNKQPPPQFSTPPLCNVMNNVMSNKTAFKPFPLTKTTGMALNKQPPPPPLTVPFQFK